MSGERIQRCNAVVTGVGYADYDPKSYPYSKDRWKITCSKGMCGRECAIKEAKREILNPLLYSGACIAPIEEEETESILC